MESEYLEQVEIVLVRKDIHYKLYVYLNKLKVVLNIDFILKKSYNRFL